MTTRRHYEISDFTITSAPVPDEDEPLYLGRGNKCDAIFITPEEERATVFPGTSDRGYESLPVITEVKLGWMGTEEIPVVESEELHVKRDKQAVLEVVCDWAKENRVPAVYYKQPDTDGELLVMDTRQISVEVVQHHVKPPSANMSAIGQSGYDKPTIVAEQTQKKPRPPIGYPKIRMPGR